jgi:hypothetical protein
MMLLSSLQFCEKGIIHPKMLIVPEVEDPSFQGTLLDFKHLETPGGHPHP